MNRTQVSNLPAPANIDFAYYGPQEPVKVAGQKKARGEYVYAFNETASLTDSLAYHVNIAVLMAAMINKPVTLQGRIQAIERIKAKLIIDATHAGQTDDVLTLEAVKRYVDNPKNLEGSNDKGTAHDVVLASSREHLAIWLDPKQLAEAYIQPIQEHFRRRTDLFLMQLVSCYGTQLHFEVGATQHQAESSKSLFVEFEGKKHKVCKRGPKQATHNAAHSSTFPCLVAYDSGKWTAHRQGIGNKPMGIYFLQNSDLYKGTNTTCNLPRFVNDADIAVDGSTHHSIFSNRALFLINQASQGSITLKKAMEEFFEAIEVQIRDQKRVAKDAGVKASLQVYYDEVKALAAEFKENPEEWIFTKIDLLINLENTTSQMRAGMLKLRSEAIRRNMRGQTELMAKINALATQLLTEIQTPPLAGQRKRNAPSYFQEAFKLVLIDNMGTDLDRQRITKLFALIDPEKVGTRKVGIAKTKEIISAAALLRGVDRVKELAKTLSADMRTLRNCEIAHRGDAMRTLRAGKNWAQVKLGRELRALYPNQPSSQSTICRTERGYRLMSDQLGTQLSETFDVPKELLLPQVFFV